MDIKEEFKKEPVAYFSAEYALLHNHCLYAGGLGVLAGDYFLEASEQGFPLVAVGLFYCKEHAQNVRSDFVPPTPESLGLAPLLNPDGSSLTVVFPVENREVHIKAWKYAKGTATLLFLDTNHENNHPDDKKITESLYAEDRNMRLKQEFVLGVGGRKVLEALHIHPSVYHLNEGHSAHLALELIKHEMDHQHISFDKAVDFARHHIVFTNHTLVAEGQELFSPDAVKKIMGPYAESVHIAIDEYIKIGIEPKTGLFSMTTLALNMSYKINAVSELHALKAKELWKGYAIEKVTNGISLSRWDSICTNESPDMIWDKHVENKRKLLAYIKEKTGELFPLDTLLVGWGRRLVAYKQPLALLKDIRRIKRLNVRIVYAGPVNERNSNANEFVAEIKRLAQGELKGRLVFLSNYNLELSKLMVSGTDVWLNTPIVGREACGTSGMKAALNGSLPLTTNDGWVYEADLKDIGWIVDDVGLSKNLLDALEGIVPLYETNEWINRMVKSRLYIQKEFSTARAFKEYVEKLYVPTYKNKKHA